MDALRLIGREIEGFRVLDVLGEGGMGVVYKAEEVLLGRNVAIKLILPAYANDEGLRKRFGREAKALARLNNPHIVAVHTARPTELGLLIAMEFVEGQTLKEWAAGGTVPWAKLAPVLREALAALGHAHELGVIHRDIKPANIMITAGGVTKVMDFGLARLQSGAESLTAARGLLGTPHYMSPEQVDRPREIDNRTDLYSLAMTAYLLLAGRLPFEKGASLIHICRTIVERDYPPIRAWNAAVPPAAAAVIERALAKRADDRYKNAAHMIAALDEVADAASISEEGDETVFDHRRRSVTILEPSPYSNSPETDDGPVAGNTEQKQPSGSRRSELGGNAKRVRKTHVLISSVAVVLLLAIVSIVAMPGRDESGLGDEVEVNDGESVASDDRGGLVPVDSVAPAATPTAPTGSEDPPPQTETAEARGVDEDGSSEISPPERTEGTIAVQTVPGGARVFVDGQFRGETPTRLSLPSGGHRLRIEKQWFGPVEREIELEAGEAVTINEELDALTGGLRVSVRPWGNVFVDGAPLAQEVSYAHDFEVQAGPRTVLVRHPELGTFERNVLVQPGETVQVAVDLREVTVRVLAFDEDNVGVQGPIYVDGEATGQWSPGDVDVRVGQRRIEVRAEGYAPSGREGTVRVGPGGLDGPLRINLIKSGG